MSSAYPVARIIVSLANIAVAIIIILSFVPILLDEMRVDVPDSSDVAKVYSNGELSLSAPVTISNGGYYSIDDIVVGLTVTNQSGSVMLETENAWGAIPAGSEVVKQISATLPIDDLLSGAFQWMLFHPDLLIVDLNVTAKYTLDLIMFNAQYEIQLPWGGLIQGYGFGSPTLFNNTGSFGIQLPYYLKTDSILHGLSGEYDVRLLNGTGQQISNATQVVTFGTNSSGSLTLPLTYQSAYDLLMNNQTLTAEISVSLPGLLSHTLTKRIEWVAPMHW
jgi:hypothetical protein